MRLARFRHQNRDRFGVVVDDGVLDLSGEVTSMREALAVRETAGLQAKAGAGGTPAKEANMAVPSCLALVAGFPARSEIGGHSHTTFLLCMRRDEEVA
jgi:Domain of unknown function (DUF2437)